MTGNSTSVKHVVTDALWAKAEGQPSLATLIAIFRLTTTGLDTVKIYGTDVLILTSLTGHNEIVTITAADILTVNSITSTTSRIINDVSLTTSSGNASVVTIDVGPAGEVSLMSAGNITEDENNATLLAADLLTANADGSIMLATKVIT